MLLPLALLLAAVPNNPNTALARRYFEEVWLKRNLDFADQVFAPTYIAHDPRSPGHATEQPRQIKDAVSAWHASAGVTGRIDDVFGEGDRVVVRWAWSIKPEGLFQRALAGRDSIEVAATEILRFENGKVVEVWRLRDDLGAQEHLGLQRIFYFQGFVVGAIVAFVISRVLSRRAARRSATALVLLLLAAHAYADRITLENGDRLTGAVVKSDAKTLTFQSELAGVVTVPWDAVTSITSSEPLHVTLTSGEVLVGVVTTGQNMLEVATPTAGRIAAARDKVASIRSQQEQAAHQKAEDRLRNPGLLDLWGGFLDVGYATSRGNAMVNTFNLGMNAARATSRDKISTHFTSTYSQNSTSGTPVHVANATRGGFRYDLNVSKKLFTYGSTDLEFDEFQKLDLRFVGGGGFGYRARRNDRTSFDLFGGGALNKEFFQQNVHRTSGEATFGEEFTHKFTKSISFREKWMMFPNLTATGQYRMQFDTGLVAALNKWFGLQTSLSDRYISNPLPGTKNNDILFTTGVRFTFQK